MFKESNKSQVAQEGFSQLVNMIGEIPSDLHVTEEMASYLKPVLEKVKVKLNVEEWLSVIEEVNEMINDGEEIFLGAV